VIFENPSFARANIEIEFTAISETLLIAETPVRLKAESEYKMDSEDLQNLKISTNKMLTQRKSHYLSSTGYYRSEFRLRGASEDLLSKIRSGKI
jgi:hypothetical protein